MQRFVLIFALSLPGSALSQSADDELVNIKEFIHDIVIDLRYNTIDNFVGSKMYSTDECFVAHSVARRLMIIQDSLRLEGLGLKMYDGYRPRAVQYLMWEVVGPPYVADPNIGSRHNRGAAVDVSLVTLATGVEIDMPTPFDFFGPEADHRYMDLPAHVIANREKLKYVMETIGGFTRYNVEWWHYEYPPAVTFPLLDFQLK